MRAAVERNWPDVQHAAASVLGDEALAGEIMELAIERAVACLTDHPPKDDEDVSATLSRFCREEIGRRRRERAQLVSMDFSSAAEPPVPGAPFSAVDAALDAERVLSDAPPAVREAIMLRYGSAESWDEVAAITGSSPAAIRMSCRRFLERIRKKLGILVGPQ